MNNTVHRRATVNLSFGNQTSTRSRLIQCYLLATSFTKFFIHRYLGNDKDHIMPPDLRRFNAVNAALHGYFDVDTGYSRRCREEIYRSINRWLNRSPGSPCTRQQTRLIINLLSGFAIPYLEEWEDLGKIFMFLEACEVGVYPALIAGVLDQIGGKRALFSLVHFFCFKIFRHGSWLIFIFYLADIASRNAWETWSDYCALAGTVIETTPGHERLILRIFVKGLIYRGQPNPILLEGAATCLARMTRTYIRHLRSRSWDMRDGTGVRVTPRNWQRWESAMTLFANNGRLTETERMSVDAAIELLRET